MKRVSTILAFGFGCVAIAAAQTAPPPTSGSEQTSANKSSDNTITVTGCLQRGDQSGAVGTTGTAGAPPATASRSQSEAGNSASFILTNAKSGSSSDMNRPAAGSTTGAPTSAGTSATAGTAGTAGTSSATAHPSAAAGSKYILEAGTAQSDLTSNVGKRVEVTGTIDSSASSSYSSSAPSAAGATSSASASASQKLRVSSVRVVGSDCSSEQ